MIYFFKTANQSIIATAAGHTLSDEELSKLAWLYGDASVINTEKIEGFFIGPRREMITPWSTNAVEITQNMNMHGISRIE
ncbi:MAG: hypothetical protein LUD48_05655, partial [Prevotella sp.]|nr:hypothetical protein [Prevotella sp.]